MSEIRARYSTTRSRQRGILTEDYFYLLDLVERMGKALGEHRCEACEEFYGRPPIDENCEFCKEARALLEELKQ